MLEERRTWVPSSTAPRTRMFVAIMEMYGVLVNVVLLSCSYQRLYTEHQNVVGDILRVVPVGDG